MYCNAEAVIVLVDAETCNFGCVAANDATTLLMHAFVSALTILVA